MYIIPIILLWRTIKFVQTYIFTGCICMKKFIFFMSLLAVVGVLSVNNAEAGISVPAKKTADNLKKCAQKSVVGTFNKTVKTITNYANDIKDSAQDVVDGKEIKKELEDLEKSFTNLEGEYTKIKDGVIKPIDKAYESVNLSLVENMAAFEKLTEAMKEKESRSVYFEENGKEVLVKTSAGKITDDIYKTIDNIPTYSEMKGAIDQINSGATTAKSSSKKAKDESSKTLKNIQKFEKGMSKILGEDFSVNDMINDIDALKEAEKYLNMDKMALPKELSTLSNIAAMKPALDAFMALNSVERVQQLQDFASTLTSVAQLQALQTAAYDSVALATEISEALQTLQTMLAALSWDSSSIKTVYDTAKDAKKTFKDVKSKVGDLKKMADKLKKAADDVKNIKDSFQKDVAKIQKMFNGDVELGELLEQLKTFPALASTVDSIMGYMDIAGKALDFQQDVLGFGKDAKSTESVMASAEPYVDDAKDKAKEWKDDIKNYFKKPKDNADEVAEKEEKISGREQTANKLKSKYKKYKEYHDKAKANLDYLEGVYSGNKDAIAKIKKAKDKLSKVASSTQISDFATDTLGITGSVKDVMNAYKAVSKVDEDKLLGPVDKFKDKLEAFKDVKDQVKEVQDLADKISKAKQIANGISNNIKNLGGLIKCFNIDLDAILEDTLLRVQDTVVEEVRKEVWKAYSEAVIDLPYLMLPDDWEDEFDSPFKKSKELGKPLSSLELKSELEQLAGVQKDEAVHPLAGMQFAEIRTIDDYKYSKPIDVDAKKFSGTLDYTDTMSAWDFKIEGVKIKSGIGIEWDFGDWKTTAWAPIFGSLKCGFNLKTDFCWYWQWQSCWFISKCYKTPMLLPTCMTNFDYKEPTVHVEVAPRNGSSQLMYMKFLRDIPGSFKSWAAGAAADTVPNVHVTAISPEARSVSNLGPMGANLTMTCDIAKKLDKFPYVQYYGLPGSPIELAKQIGRSMVDLKDWKKEWFTEEAPELGKFPASLQMLYASEINKNEWNPRAFPGGWTPSGETKPDYEDIRDESYKWALPYLKEGLDTTQTTIASGTDVIEDYIYMNKCDAGLAEDGTNVCLGKWGALFPRNGQVAVEDTRYPLKRYAQLAYRAYDRTLELGYIGDLRKQPETEMYGVGYDKTEFSLDWPYRTNRYKVGEDPKYWARGYYGEEINSGGMVMTLWKDTSCCVKVCCDMSMFGYYPGESYYFSLPYWEDEKWKITDVTKHK